MTHPCLLVLLFLAAPAALTFAQPTGPQIRPTLTIPRVDAPPRLQDFLTTVPPADALSAMARVEGFVQRWPTDGAPERRRTVAYLAYTTEALHVVYQAFDPNPEALRAHLMRREEVFVINDDAVELRLDTFGDARESYYLVANPRGVQLDAAWPEGGGQYDESFDLVWTSAGQVTEYGFVVVMSVPFTSLRFDPAKTDWGIYLGRWMPSTGEWTFWPHISSGQRSYLAQMARLDGLSNISPGRGLQLIPYASSRSFATPDRRDGLEPRIGVDVKGILRNSVVVDLAVNPDFSQVESDAPQITTNQRFEVFFPEKRPFFLENAGLLQTPLSLLFTRRISDPQAGVKVTGRMGPWSVGLLGTDDRGPGRLVGVDSGHAGSRAWAGLARVTRHVRGRSSVGAMVTQRSFGDRDNTVGSVDTRLLVGRAWAIEAQLARSRVQSTASTRASGNAAHVSVAHTGRVFSSRTALAHLDRSFTSDLGFVPRVGVRQLTQSLSYIVRPDTVVTDVGPSVVVERVWSDRGEPLDWRARTSVSVGLKGATTLSVFGEVAGITLGADEGAADNDGRDLRTQQWGFSASTSPRPTWAASTSVSGGRAAHFSPVQGRQSETGRQWNLQTTIRWRPLTALRIDTTWLRTSLDLDDGREVFATDIVRSQWAWQFTRAWSARLIGRIDSTRRDASITTIRPARTLNLDLLVTRLINPWTAVYVGANRDARGQFAAADSWQVFVKWSHLLRW
jgi:hypothetical protein